VICGIDLTCADLAAPAAEYRIFEINAAPSLDHFATSSLAAREAVERFYMRALSRAIQGSSSPRDTPDMAAP
jgi:hypothetical protein